MRFQDWSQIGLLTNPMDPVINDQVYGVSDLSSHLIVYERDLDEFLNPTRSKSKNKKIDKVRKRGFMRKIRDNFKLFLCSLSYLFIMTSFAETTSHDLSRQFTDSFLATVFESDNLNNPELFFHEIKDYFDFSTIGRSLLKLEYQNFTSEEFKDFVKVFPPYEVYKLLTYVDKLSDKEVNFVFRRLQSKEKQYGTLYYIDYNYMTKRILENVSEDKAEIPGRISFQVIKRKGQDEYKIVNIYLDGVNFILYRSKYYKNLVLKEKNPREIIQIIESKD